MKSNHIAILRFLTGDPAYASSVYSIGGRTCQEMIKAGLIDGINYRATDDGERALRAAMLVQFSPISGAHDPRHPDLIVVRRPFAYHDTATSTRDAIRVEAYVNGGPVVQIESGGNYEGMFSAPIFVQLVWLSGAHRARWDAKTRHRAGVNYGDPDEYMDPEARQFAQPLTDVDKVRNAIGAAQKAIVEHRRSTAAKLGEEDGIEDVNTVLREQGRDVVIATLREGHLGWDEAARNAGAHKNRGIGPDYVEPYYIAYESAARMRAVEIRDEGIGGPDSHHGAE